MEDVETFRIDQAMSIKDKIDVTRRSPVARQTGLPAQKQRHSKLRSLQWRKRGGRETTAG